MRRALPLDDENSYVGTVLRYRCGLVPSLDSPRFAECRRSIPTVRICVERQRHAVAVNIVLARLTLSLSLA